MVTASLIVSTYNRPGLLAEAVQSAGLVCRRSPEILIADLAGWFSHPLILFEAPAPTLPPRERCHGRRILSRPRWKMTTQPTSGSRSWVDARLSMALRALAADGLSSRSTITPEWCPGG